MNAIFLASRFRPTLLAAVGLFILLADRAMATDQTPGWQNSDGQVSELPGLLDGYTASTLSQKSVNQSPSKKSGFAMQTLSVPSSDADYITPELQNLAAGLKNDRMLIFNWVRDNIRYTHYHGCKKGAYLTYLERCGNDIDQSALLVALWRAAGIECHYVYGYIAMPLSDVSKIDWQHYLGADPSEITNLIYSRGTPASYAWDPQSGWKALNRMWVQANDGGVWTNYDPSFKLIERQNRENLATLTGYVRSSLLTALGAGNTTLPSSITSLNSTNLASYLSGNASTFANTIRSGHFEKSPEQIVGGWTHLSQPTVDNNSFPVGAAGYEAGIYNGAIYDILPDGLYSKISVQAASVGLSWGVNPTVNLASLRGRRLALKFVSGKATLQLDDDQVAQATTATTTATPVTISIDHADSSVGDQSNASDPVVVALNGLYALPYGYDVSPEYVKSRQLQLSRYDAQGVAESDDRKRLETLNIMGLQWYLETSAARSMVADINQLSNTFLHRIGRVAQEPSTPSAYVYIDVKMNYNSLVSRIADATGAVARNSLIVSTFIESAMEHGVLEQMQPNIPNALSTAKLLKLANDTNIPVFLANSSNYTTSASPIRPQIAAPTAPAATAYSASDLAALDNAITTNGGEALLPKSGQITSGSWKGAGYAVNYSLAGGGYAVGMLISGGLNGGFSSIRSYVSTAPVVYQSYTRLTASIDVSYTRNLGGDPVDLSTGDFTHERSLLTAGEGLVGGLDFKVSYHGGQAIRNGSKIGYGWTHSYDVRASESADLDGAFGRTTPLEMSAALAGTVAALDVFQNRAAGAAGVKDWLATALIANWIVDELKGSQVAIVAGDRVWQFHRQPAIPPAAPTYLPPAGSTLALSKNAQGNYELKERNGPTWRFDANKNLQEIEDLWGKKLTLTYYSSGVGSGQVASVTDAYGRSLAFTYDLPGIGGSRLTVADTAGRIILLWGNSAGDLTTLTDAEGKSDRFTYNADHRITQVANDDNSVAVTNYYDSLNRVYQQDALGDSARRWTFFYADGLTIVREPDGVGTADTWHYFDDKKRETGTVNALGEKRFTFRDAQNRIVRTYHEATTGGNLAYENEYFAYDTRNNLLTALDGDGTTTNAYDGQDHLTSIQDKLGNFTYFQSYNAQHQPTQVTDREGRVTTTTYKSTGDVAAGMIATISEGGNVTTYGYDTQGALNSIQYPGGASESRVNNVLGDPTTITDENSRATTISYNNRREVTSTTSPGTPSSGSRTTSTAYDDRRNIASVTNARGYATSYTYDADGKPRTSSAPGGAIITTHYDARDRIDWTSNPLGQTTNFGRDVLGRIVTATDPLSRSTTTIYEDGLRRVRSISPAPLNYQTLVATDALGRPVRNEDGLGNYTQPGYDANGNKTSLRDRRAKNWSFTYDKEGRLKTVATPLGRTTTQTWNSRGLLETINEPSNQLTTLGYDNRRRLISRADGAGTIIYGLDNASQLLTVTQDSAVLTRTYHPSGEAATYKNSNNETISYDYDRNGNLTSITYPAIGSVAAATVTYTYDNRDRLQTVTDWASRVTTYTWNDANQLVLVQRPNGTRRALRWDAAGQLLAIEERPASGAPIAIRSFQYDAAGRVAKRIAYPQAAPWTEAILNAGVDDDNRLTGGVLGYDADGNTLASMLPDGPWGSSGASSNATGTFMWNARNQLTSVTRTGGQTATYTYDAEGNLITSVDSVAGTTRWIIDPNGGKAPRVLARVAPGGQVTRYVYGIGLAYEVRQDGSTRQYHYDQVGSTLALTDGNGAVTGRADYSPYGALQGGTGELANANTTPFLFVGAHGVITDSVTGLHQMRARWYASSLRRFLNEDPSGFAGGENFYAYAAGNPVSLIDPLGLRPQIGSGRGSTILNAVQTGLDVVSLAPGIGSVASVANTLIHVARGNYGQAALSALGAIPGGALVTKGAAVLGAVSVGIKITKTTQTTLRAANNAAEGLRLAKSLASEAQLTEVGTIMAGSGGRTIFRDAGRVAQQYGGSPGDWVKKTSSTFIATDGTKVETHWVENIKTGQRVEYKTKTSE